MVFFHKLWRVEKCVIVHFTQKDVELQFLNWVIVAVGCETQNRSIWSNSRRSHLIRAIRSCTSWSSASTTRRAASWSTPTRRSFPVDLPALVSCRLSGSTCPRWPCRMARTTSTATRPTFISRILRIPEKQVNRVTVPLRGWTTLAQSRSDPKIWLNRGYDHPFTKTTLTSNRSLIVSLFWPLIGLVGTGSNSPGSGSSQGQDPSWEKCTCFT